MKINNQEYLNTPYDKYKKLEIWYVIEQAIKDLVDNQDLKESTNRDYIVGYIIKSLETKKLL